MSKFTDCLYADRTRQCGAGLLALRNDHLHLLDNIRKDEQDGTTTPVLEDRIAAVTESLDKLEVGVAESGVIIALASHFDRLEADRTLARMEMRRMQVSLPKLCILNIQSKDQPGFKAMQMKSPNVCFCWLLCFFMKLSWLLYLPASP